MTTLAKCRPLLLPNRQVELDLSSSHEECQAFRNERDVSRRSVINAFPCRYLRHPVFVLASFERSFEVRRELVILKRLRIAPNLKSHEIILVNGGLIEIVSKVSCFRTRRRANGRERHPNG